MLQSEAEANARQKARDEDANAAVEAVKDDEVANAAVEAVKDDETAESYLASWESLPCWTVSRP